MRQLTVLRRRELRFKAGPGEVLEAGHDTERRLDAAGACSLAAPRDPLQHAHVFAEAGPDEAPLAVAAEPVHPKNLRRLLERSADLQPVTKVVAHVVAAKGEHRHRIT